MNRSPVQKYKRTCHQPLNSILIVSFLCNLTDTNKHTLYSHDAAHHHNMAALPSFHVRQHLFHQACQPKEVCIKELLHGSNTLALQRSNHAKACVIHCNSRTAEQQNIPCYYSVSLQRELKLTYKVCLKMRGDRPRISTLLSGRLLTHSLMEASQQASNCLISRVLFKEPPAAFSKAPRFPRSLIVATTASEKQ